MIGAFRISIWAIGVVALALAGCEEIPHPFQPERKPLPPAFAAAGRHHAGEIAVTPIKGLPEPLGEALAAAMVTALEKRSLPARLDRAAEADALYSVSGRFETGPPSPGGEAAIVWELRDGGGLLVARQSQSIPRAADMAAAPVRDKLLADTAGEPARMMAKGIEGDAPLPVATAAAAAPPPAGHRAVAIGRIQGAPVKDGDVTLRQAIEYALRVGAVRVVRDPGPESLLLNGAVELGEPASDIRHVKVTWVVARPDGKEVGRVSQENNVPTRLIERVWGEICAAVAHNATGGIAALVAEADRPASSP